MSPNSMDTSYFEDDLDDGYQGLVDDVRNQIGDIQSSYAQVRSPEKRQAALTGMLSALAAQRPMNDYNSTADRDYGEFTGGATTMERASNLLSQTQDLAAERQVSDNAVLQDLISSVKKSNQPDTSGLDEIAARYGMSDLFGHKDYEQAKAQGYSDDEILAYLKQTGNANQRNLGPDGLVGQIERGQIDYTGMMNIDRGPDYYQGY